ncbi:MAG TPA: hypothetical protein PKY59_03910 [Pyrinomonadaceae bacterium]|nr:hypothetical protein [Pyrinomonadaceae bacterium]
MKNIISLSAVFLFLYVFVPSVSAQTNDWNALSSRINSEIAVKADKQKTVFGILSEADSSQIKVKTSIDGKVSEVAFNRASVEKIWSAKLSKGTRKTLQGTLIGAGVGAGAGLGASLILLAATGGSDGTGTIVAIGTAIGAGAGAALGSTAGFFTRSGNKKQQLIYQR